MAGLVAKMFVWFLELRILGPLIVLVLKRKNLIHKLVSNAEIEETPIFVPSHPYEDDTEQQVIEVDSNLTPRMVAERLIAAVNDSCNGPLKMSFFINLDAKDILRQSMESTDRYRQGELISVLDGVPIAINDEIDCLPYPTTGGTKWLHKLSPCKEDACCVKRLRSCGAILVGKTNMHELGAGTSEINPHYGYQHNTLISLLKTGEYA